jgi:hypothetical protein
MPENESTSPEFRAKTKLGGRCVAKTCGWHNEDGTYGCSDLRVLQFHHKEGGGSAARRDGTDSNRMIAYEILRYIKRGWPPRFELLCAICHAIDSKPRQQGARLHKQPARIRRSQQKEGQPMRRVREKAEVEAEQAERRFLAAMRQQSREDAAFGD